VDPRDPTMTINRVIEATRVEQVKGSMNGKCTFALATARHSTIKWARRVRKLYTGLVPAVAGHFE
jgi:hypothetical protein